MVASALIFWQEPSYERMNVEECLSYAVTSIPGGMNSLSGQNVDWVPQKIKLKFSARTVSLNDFKSGGWEPKRDFGFHYEKDHDTVQWDRSGSLAQLPLVPAHWECRLFKDDDAKLICGITISGSEQPALFEVYSREDSQDSPIEMGALLNFTPSMPSTPKIIKSQQKQ